MLRSVTDGGKRCLHLLESELHAARGVPHEYLVDQLVVHSHAGRHGQGLRASQPRYDPPRRRANYQVKNFVRLTTAQRLSGRAYAKNGKQKGAHVNARIQSRCR